MKIGKLIQDLALSHEIIKFLIKRDFVVQYRNFALGYLWWVLNPLLFMALFTFVFTVIFKVGIENYPLFVFCGLLPWRAFASAASKGVGQIPAYESMLKQVNFPKISLPVASSLYSIVEYLGGLPIIIVLMLLFNIAISPSIIFLIYLLFIQFVITLGFTLIVSVVGTRFPDFSQILRVMIQAGLYLSPIVYPLSRIPDSLIGIFMLNPFATLMPAYRDVILNGTLPPLNHILICSGEAFVLLLVGLQIFYTYEKKLIKWI